jgi:hypothetical protein
VWGDRPCAASDQYALAVVFQLALTGVRPFAATTLHGLAVRHLTDPPDLDALPRADRRAVGRALHKNPAGRFPSCRAFVASLPR